MPLTEVDDKLVHYLESMFPERFVNYRWGLISVYNSNRHNSDEICCSLFLNFLNLYFPNLSIVHVTRLHNFFSISTDYDRDLDKVVLCYRFNVAAIEAYLEREGLDALH